MAVTRQNVAQRHARLCRELFQAAASLDTGCRRSDIRKPRHASSPRFFTKPKSQTLAYQVIFCIYNIYFHPLSKYPGPRLAAASPLWLASSYIGGKTPTDLLELHNKYGPVVRTSPDGLSYINAPQWKEIYGHKAGQLEFSKDEKYFAGLKGEPLILNADRNYHGYIRKLFAHGFSEKAMREQESVLKQYVDLMFRRVEEEGQDGTQSVDILKWFNVSAFSIVLGRAQHVNSSLNRH